MFQILASKKIPRVTIPDMSAKALLAITLRKLRLGNAVPDTRFFDWDFWLDASHAQEVVGRGATFEVVHLVREPGFSGRIKPEQAQAYLAARGAVGHVGAFLTWLMIEQPQTGLITTLPPEKERFTRGNRGHFYVPCAEARHGYGVSDLDLRWTGEDWDSACQYLGFRLN